METRWTNIAISFRARLKGALCADQKNGYADLLLRANSETEEVLPPPEGPHFFGYPVQPFYLRVADNLAYWMVSKKCPMYELPELPLLKEERKKYEKEPIVLECLKECYDTWEQSSDDCQREHLVTILQHLGLRGILDLLGMRCTAGSCCVVPPSRETLLASFQKRKHPVAKLSLGGRALSKHCHRDDSNQWWGECTGSEDSKNEYALSVANRILDAAVWINIHTIVHEVQILEVRNEKGYGLRWTHDGSEFRGFLEPQMQEGHAVGWRH